MSVIKKIIICLAFAIVLFLAYLYDQHQQLPQPQDVYKITPQLNTRVYFVKKIDNDWITIFGNDRNLMLGRLENDWLGRWRIGEYLGDANINPNENQGIVWGVSEQRGPVSYYFGMIRDPDIQTLIIETDGEVYQDVPIFESEGKQFFYLKRDGNALPFSFKGLSKEGEIIFSD